MALGHCGDLGSVKESMILLSRILRSYKCKFEIKGNKVLACKFMFLSAHINNDNVGTK